MSDDLISTEKLHAVFSNASSAVPIMVERFSRHTPLDAHAKAGIPAPLLAMLETLPYLSADGETVPKAKVEEYLRDYLAKSVSPSHKPLLNELAGWTARELGIPLDIPTSMYSFRDQQVLKSITRYTDAANYARQTGLPLVSQETIDAALMPIAKRFIELSKHPNIYRLNDEERNVLTKEVLDFSCAPAFDPSKKTNAHNRPAYKTDFYGLTGENLDKAYHHMLGCAGSQNYRNVVGAIFRELADALCKQLPSPSRQH